MERNKEILNSDKKSFYQNSNKATSELNVNWLECWKSSDAVNII